MISFCRISFECDAIMRNKIVRVYILMSRLDYASYPSCACYDLRLMTRH